MPNLTRAQILARKTGKGTATLPDGTTVSVRALTRNEVLAAQDEFASAGERDTRYIAWAMTDPKLTVDEVRAWADAAPAGDLVAVSDAIAMISGLVSTAGKDAYKSTGE